MSTQHENATPSRETASKETSSQGLETGILTATRPGENLQNVQLAANASAPVQQLMAFQAAADQSPQVRQLMATQAGVSAAVQRKENKTGLPDQLKNGVEGLSGMAMDDVKVHYNSDKPAQMQAHAYAQGTDIHVAPGQEKHVPHEAWHVVQQKQGRVQATTQLKGKVAINDDAGLENEADVMGAKAMQMKAMEGSLAEKSIAAPVAQRVENAEAEAEGAEGLDPEIMAIAEMLEAQGVELTVEAIEAAMEMGMESEDEMESEGEMESEEELEAEEEMETEMESSLSGEPVQRAKTHVSTTKKKKGGNQNIAKVNKVIQKPKKTTNQKKTKKAFLAKALGVPQKKIVKKLNKKPKTRYGGHDSTKNKKAILDVIKHRKNNLPLLNLKSLSIPEETSFQTGGFGKQNKTTQTNMTNGTAICHKLAESEVFKSMDTMIDAEIKSNDVSDLEKYLTALLDYIDPKHITNDNCPGGGDYEDEVKSKFNNATTAFTDMKKEAIGSSQRQVLAHAVGKNVVNSPVNLFNGSSSENSSIQEHLDGNKYVDINDNTPLTPRSSRAKQVQSQFSNLIEGPSKDLNGKDRTSSLL